MTTCIGQAGSEGKGTQPPSRMGLPRREVLKTVALAGSAATTAGVLAAPYVSNAQAAAGISLKVQSLWIAGNPGQQVFEAWCHSMVERTSGELALVPFAAGDIVEVFEMSDAVAGGVLDGMLWQPIYWAATGRMPAAAFLSSLPMGLNHPHQWDMLFESYGGTQLARELYAKQGAHFAGHVHHDLNLIHSKRPIRSLTDFEGLKIRMPGGLVADCFTAIGARTVTLGAHDVYPALATGAIDAADFAGPAINYALGLGEVCDYIVMGPPSTPCLHQPVDLFEVSFNLQTPTARPPEGDPHRSGTHLLVAAFHRHPEGQCRGVGDVRRGRDHSDPSLRGRRRPIPADRGPVMVSVGKQGQRRGRVFRLHLEVMQNPSVAYLTPDDIRGYELKA